MESTNTQLLFFGHIKNGLPPHLSLVDEIAELLNISIDSAYRRIRGEKPISFEEIQVLCGHYKISLDQFLNLKSDAFIFTGKLDNDKYFGFKNWMEEVLKQYSIISSFEKKHIYFLLKDLPFNLHFQLPELAAFKYFVWSRSFLSFKGEKGVKFAFDYPQFEEHNAVGMKIVNVYNSIPTTEIWNTESINTTIRQIEYYYEAGRIVSKEQAVILLDNVLQLVNHIEKEAELGRKFKMGEQPNGASAEYRLFNNELILGDNSLLAELGDMKVTFINHSIMHFMGTKDVAFNNAMFNNLNNLMQKSTLISTSNERERVWFFNRIREEIKHRKSLL
jgi:hypothetical protein